VFASKGKRVLIYDCDVQRSLTAWLLGNNFEIYRDSHPNDTNPFENFLNNSIRFNSHVFARSLADQMQGEGEIRPAFAVKLKENLYLVQGSRDLIQVDERIAKEESFCIAMTNMNMGERRNDYTGKLYHSIMKTAKSFDIDFVFLDMNPYPGNINRCLIMCSHYLIIPACLDYFCQEMMFQMRRNITEWDRRITAITRFTNYHNSPYPWPDHKPKLLGFIANMFSNFNYGIIQQGMNWLNLSKFK
jgi:cellulose biosynthesis protein BcsQ